MKQYIVVVEIKHTYSIRVEADSESEAAEIVSDMEDVEIEDEGLCIDSEVTRVRTSGEA